MGSDGSKGSVVVHLLAAAAVLLAGSRACAADEDPGKALVGTWERDGKVAEFAADGTGKNYDGSRFHWEFRGERLIVRPRAAGGQPGEEWSVPIALTRDGKEYSYLLGGTDGGRTRITWYKLGSGGRRYAGRTKEDCAYPPGTEALKGEGPPEGDAPTLRRSPARSEREERPAPGAVVRVGPNVQVSRDRDGIYHGEVVIAADPSDPRRLLAASMFQPPPVDPAVSGVAVYGSDDGGATWSCRLEHTEANPRTFADPTLAYAADGIAYFADMDGASLEEYHEGGRGIGLRFARSRDNGRSWDPPVRVEGWFDRPFLAIDRTGGRYRGRVYCDTLSGLLVSADGGATFEAPRAWPARGGYRRFSQAAPAVLSDGSVVLLHGSEPVGGGEDRTGRGFLAARRSADGGATFSEAVEVAAFATGGRRYGNIPALAAGPRHDDRLYAVWTDVDADGDHRIYVSRSTDKGVTWSKPALVSGQGRLTAAGLPIWSRHDAFLPSIAVNRGGVVGIAWYDTRVAPGEEPGWQYRFRASLDGGETWRPSVQVSERRTTRARRAAGHTGGLAAAADGAFHPLWIDGRTGEQQVWTARVTIDAGDPGETGPGRHN